MSDKPKLPGICTALNVLGWLSIVGAVFLLFMAVMALSTMGMGAPKVGGNLLALGVAGGAGAMFIGYAFEAGMAGLLLLAASKGLEMLAAIRAANLIMLQNHNG